jgi:hypothetical protein
LLVGALIGFGVAIVLLVVVAGLVAWRHPVHRADGAPTRAHS